MPPTWKKQLRLLIDQQRDETGIAPRLAIVGVGNLMRSDDAAGFLAVRALAQRPCAAKTDRVLLLEAGVGPENTTAEVRAFAPNIVLFIDAAEMGETPGMVRTIPEDSIDGMSASTHSLPLSLVAHYLRLELDCIVTFLGIQAASNEVGETVSAEVLRAVDQIVDGLDALLRRID